MSPRAVAGDLLNVLRRRRGRANLLLAAVLLSMPIFVQPALGSPLIPAGANQIVTGISPNVGPEAGGTSVEITGSGFTGATAVDFGTNAAESFTVTDDGTITATSPAGTGTVDVTVTTPSGTSTTSSADQFTYEPVPTVTGIGPPSTGPLAGGTSVTITGSGFTGATEVDFGANAATSFTVIDDGTITATSPAGTGTVDITVTAPGGTSTTSSADQFTYEAAPTVTNINPTAGPLAGGTSVAITGTGFTDASAVSFGLTAATSFTINSATSITATSPAGTRDGRHHGHGPGRNVHDQ